MLGMDMGAMTAGGPVGGMGGVSANANLGARGYGSKILRITGMMLEKAVVWPGE